jgi:hypothetical protein
VYKNVVFGGLRLHGVVVSEKELVESGKHGCRRHYSRFCVGRCRNGVHVYTLSEVRSIYL